VSGAVILMYHRVGDGRLPGREAGEDRYTVPADTLEAHLDLIREAGCPVLPVDGIGSKARLALPPKALSITFDDGNESDRSLALAALSRRKLPAAFFVTPAWVGQAGFMTWDEVRELRAAGMTVGAHGLDHSFLAYLSERELRVHLAEARRLMEDRLGEAPSSLALPGGSGGRREVRVARELGFRQVFGSVPRLAPGIDVDPIPRFAVRRADSLAAFRALVEQRTAVRLRSWLRYAALGGLRSLFGPRYHARLRDKWLGVGPARDE
jgi:peptidoglycan/xylan/chitin deacetylase (PgdA/CDA1 family)